MRAFTWFLLMFEIMFVSGGSKLRLGRSEGGNLGGPGGYQGETLPEERWFEQKLDHSNPSDSRTFRQRYYVNDRFYNYNRPGPIFLMVGGEGPVDPRWMVRGTWILYAKKFRAMCINLEHRYYGKSRPTSDMSVANLRYLTSSQALADLAAFITKMNEKLKVNRKVKWVAFGGSYPGSLAAWLRMKYPHLVYAAVSSSGPLMAKINFMEYFQVVVDALKEKTGSDECTEQVKLAHEQIEVMIKIYPDEIEKIFRVCQPFAIATEDDMKNFYSYIADEFADLVQYNEDNRIGANEAYRNITINTVCDMMTKPQDLPAYKKLAKFVSIMLNKNGKNCTDYAYGEMIKGLKNVTWGMDGARQWMYQTCTEFGFFQTSSSVPEVFGDHFTVDFFYKQCVDVFGAIFDEEFIKQRVEWTNTDYGSLDISVQRVVFVHGSVDPWHKLGITTTQDNNTPAVYIKGTAHCANMYPPADTDSSQLKEARLEIQQYLGLWLDPS